MDKIAAGFADHFPLLNQLVTTRFKYVLAAAAALFLILAVGFYGALIFESEELYTKAGPIIGGDFIVFRQAAIAAIQQDMTSIYKMANLKAQLQAAYPGKGEFNFAWMYPPTMSLVIAPFAWPPYLVAFALWVAIFGGGFLFLLTRLWNDRWALFFAASSPAVFQGIITGQNGFLTASLLALAGAFAERRPVVAGIAAGLLTIKPQLGILIPFAFLAAGCWRAFFTAGATAIILALASLFAFGPESWAGFYEGITAHGARMATETFPFNKLVTPFGFVTLLGAPPAAAAIIQAAATAALICYVVIVWRRVKDWDLRVAALSSAALLATPYAFYYEIVIMVPPMFLIARRAMQSGWLRYEKISLVAVWIMPLMMPGPASTPTLSYCATGAFLAFLIAARRTLPAANFRFATEAPPAQAGS